VTRSFAVLAIMTAVRPAAGQAQQAGAPCAMQLDSIGGLGRQVEIRPGQVHQFGSGGVWASCRGQDTRMYADSVAWFSERGRVDFVGRVTFRDDGVTLDAERASYFPADERLEAYGAVRLENRDTGSELMGPNLTYWRERPGVRDTAELYATARPTVRYPVAADLTGEPYVIVGQQVRLRGRGHAWAGGAVTVDRVDFGATADSAELDLDGDGGEFVGHAQVTGRGATGYVLTGRRIPFHMTEGKLSWVQAQGLGDAASGDWRLTADTIEFRLDDGQVEGGVAWGDSLRPNALSTTYTMRADSLALDTPGQQLSEIRGFGTAVATARVDSTALEPDWVGGDSLVARFGEGEDGRRLLHTLEARGSARAFYRVLEEGGTLLAGINYSRGRRIVASFRAEGVNRVDVMGAGDGVYLEPKKRPPP